jgi:hypothetical protein
MLCDRLQGAGPLKSWYYSRHSGKEGPRVTKSPIIILINRTSCTEQFYTTAMSPISYSEITWFESRPELRLP